jgi:hypothetical protein
MVLLRAASALILILGTSYVSYALANRALRGSPLAVRWTGTAVVGLWLASIGFHLLLQLHLFTLPAALAGVAALVAAVRTRGMAFSEFARRVARDACWFRRFWRTQSGFLPRALTATVAFLAATTTARALILPPLGWDTHTYHLVKAGMWVQTGGPLTLDAPGGWSFYRSYFGGGEILTAWAMLPFGSDLLAGLVDAVHWLLIGVAVYALGQELGLRARQRALAAAYVLSIPCLRFQVGTGYVEPALDLALAAAALFAVRFLRRREPGAIGLTLMALGVAAGIKISAWPSAGFLLLALAGGVAATRRRRRELLLAFGAGGLAAALAAGPWLVRNALETGYPLSTTPIEVAGITLGKENPALIWYGERPEVRAYELGPELQAITAMLGSPLEAGPHLSAASAIPLALFIPGWIALLRRRPGGALALLGVVSGLVVFFYNPGFSVARHVFAWVNGRFLVPIVSVAVLVSLPRSARPGPGGRVYAGILWLWTLVHVAVGTAAGWGSFELLAIPGLVLFGGALWMLGRHLVRHPSPRIGRLVRLAFPAALACLAVANLDFLRQATRYRAVAESTVFHGHARYWGVGAKAVDDPGTERQIAVTAGPYRDADNWGLYLFLGRRLQNELHYIPITESGRIVEFGPEGMREAAASSTAWLRRLDENGITEVMSFEPAGIELFWLERRPDLFERIAGNGESWGVYRVRREALRIEARSPHATRGPDPHRALPRPTA